jgi:predicted aldo/keto reductase-like oxidoreductase
MKKIKFGNTGLNVSILAFGGIPIMRVSKTEAAKIVREAIDLGINFIDTANAYSDSEEKIGEAIKGLRREDLVIATKSTAPDKKTFNEHLDLSLKQLGVDYIDIHQLHNVSSKEKRDAVFAPGGAMEGLEEAIKKGKVRFPGFSSHSVPLAIEIMKSGKFVSVQLPVNYIDCEAAIKAIPLAKKMNIGFIAMKPLGGGLLHDAGLAFRYLASFDSIVPDPGIEKIEELREIVALLEKNVALSEADKSESERQKVELGPSWCHRCDYCQPCPQGISISSVLSVKSIFKRMPLARPSSMVGGALEKAKTCVECGICVTRCPYHIHIPAQLKERINFWENQTKA